MSKHISIPKHEIERIINVLRYGAHPHPSPHADYLAQLLEEPAPAQDGREAFEKYMFDREHPVIGWIDEHWFKRGDDPETYANDYVQGAWVMWQVRPAQTEHQPCVISDVTHWEKSLAAAWPADEHDAQGAWIIGTTDEDGNKYDVITVEADQYDAPGDSEKIARALIALWSQAFAAPKSQTEHRPAPDAVWEALQRMIETTHQLGPHSREDAQLVARYRDRYRLLAATIEQAEQQPVAAEAPPGYALVPIKPTIEMVEAGYEEGLGAPDRSEHTRVIEQYDAMLAAAPIAQTEQPYQSGLVEALERIARCDNWGIHQIANEALTKHRAGLQPQGGAV